jgi:biotin carboxyl carrier protein
VAVGLTARLDDDPVIVVAPPPEHVLRGLPVVTGEGLLGGVVSRDRAHSALAMPIAGTVLVDGEAEDLRLETVDGRHATLHRGGSGDGAGGERITLLLEPAERRQRDGISTREVVVGGWRIEVEIEAEARASLRERAHRNRSQAGAGGPVDVRAIIPGRIVAVSVAQGDAVTAGQQMLVLEAMKMQNELRAPRDGTIDRVGVAVGSDVEVGDLLLVIR